MSEKNTQAEAPSERDSAIEEAFESASFALLRPNTLQSMAHIMDVLHCRVQDVFQQRVAALATQQAGQGEAVGTVVEIDPGDEESDPHAWVELHDTVNLGDKLYITTPPAPQQPEAGRFCPRCGGSGEQMHLSGGGPDAYEVLGPCNECNGTGEPKPEALAQQERVPLTDEQRKQITAMWGRENRNYTVADIIDAVEAAHGIRAARSSEGGQS